MHVVQLRGGSCRGIEVSAYNDPASSMALDRQGLFSKGRLILLQEFTVVFVKTDFLHLERTKNYLFIKICLNSSSRVNKQTHVVL